MSITRAEIEAFGMPATTMLARIATGRGQGDLKPDDLPKRRTTSIRLDPDLLAWIDDMAAKCKAPRNAIVEILLWSGRKSVEEQVERDSEELSEVKK